MTLLNVLLFEAGKGRSVLSVMGQQPAKVDGRFSCTNNKLTSLEGAPAHVGSGFYCYSNQLTSLKGAPAHVGGNFSCDDNRLTSLEGAPNHVGGNFWCNDKLPLLRLLTWHVKRLHHRMRAAEVMNKYLHGAPCSRQDILKCQQELIDAGFEEEAEF